VATNRIYKMKKIEILSFLLLFSIKVIAQSVTINPQANNSGIINVQSTNKGVLVPNMTSAQRVAIVPLQNGLLVFDTTTNTFWFYNGTAWLELLGNSGGSTYFTPTASATQLSSSDFQNFNFLNGSNISAGSNGYDGTLKIYSPSGSAFNTNYLNLDASTIQAKSYNVFNGKTEQNLTLNPFGGKVGIGTTTPTAKLTLNGDLSLGDNYTYLNGVGTYNNINVTNTSRVHGGASGQIITGFSGGTEGKILFVTGYFSFTLMTLNNSSLLENQIRGNLNTAQTLNLSGCILIYQSIINKWLIVASW
jgi:hypothetical protein